MSLTPEVAAIGDKMRSANISFTDFSEAEARQVYIKTLARSAGEPVTMARVEDVSLALSGRKLKAQRY